MTDDFAIGIRREVYSIMWMLAMEVYMCAPEDGVDRHLALENFYLRMIEVG